jgi:hypothetical protein
MQCLLCIFQKGKISPYRFLLLFNLIIALGGGIIASFAALHSVYAATSTSTVTCSNTTSIKPNSNSLLIVLLDRSGSLGFNNGGTDPDNFSASVTDALSDLWPGPMAVIAFPSGGNDTLLIGPSLAGQRDDLKNTVNGLLSQGVTPLESAMEAAQSLLQRQSFPRGSRLVLITDGMPDTASDPTGAIEENDILQTLAPKFCQEGVAVNPVGLTIAENSNAAQFLQQVANESGGYYQRVSTAQELAGVVISLYAAWDGLEFNLIQKDQAHGYYPIIIDSSVQSAYILTFYQSGKNDQLSTTSGSAPQYTSTSDGRHYEIDTLLTPGAAATYTVRTADPNAIVYDLVNSTRTLQLVKPVSGATADTGGFITIQAHLVDQGRGPVVPNDNGQPFFQAIVTETVRGRTLPPEQIDLTRLQPGSDLFVGTYAVPSDAKPGEAPVSLGTLQIRVMAIYQGVEHATNPLTIPVVIPKYIPPPPPPCGASFWQCVLLQANLVAISSAIPLLLLLLLLILWYRQPVPFGMLLNIPKSSRNRARSDWDEDDYIKIPLGRKRILWNRLFHRSVITSDELREISIGRLSFDKAHLEFVAKRGKAARTGDSDRKETLMFVQPAADNRINDIKVQAGGEEFHVMRNKPQPLRSGSIIVVNGTPKARYQ